METRQEDILTGSSTNVINFHPPGMPLLPGVFGKLRPEARAEKFLRLFDGLLSHLRRIVADAISEECNPFIQTGAIANVMFLVSVASGILLIFWYVPSVHEAWDSVEAMRKSPWLAGLLRSLHRYSSDACMLFALLHAGQIFSGRRFTAARWLPWVTGIALVGLLWFDGWLGYWLVWDDRAAEIARGTAKLLDVLPVFAAPFSMSLVSDEAVSSLLFFLVFFLHMIIPIGFGIALWLHISRLSSSKFLTSRFMAVLLTVSLIVVSLLFPAASSRRAEMLAMPQEFTIDSYFMLPLYLTNRLGGGVLWGLTFLVTVIFTTVPWYMVRRHLRPALVHRERCSGCSNCFHDCPFNAVKMHSREGTQANVSVIDPAKCVACSICVGSCDRGAIDFPEMPLPAAGKRMDKWLSDDAEAGRKTFLAFLCTDSPASVLSIDPTEGRCDSLPGYRLMVVPCIGWVHHSLIERAALKGAAGVLLAGCGLDSHGREGGKWMAQRLAGIRKPGLMRERIGGMPLRFLQLERTEKDGLIRTATAFREGADWIEVIVKRTCLRWIGPAVLVFALAGLTIGFSDVRFRGVGNGHSEISVSFTHLGQPLTVRDRQETENDRLPHMRGVSTERPARAPIRLRVTVDGKPLHEHSYRPGGLFRNSASNAIVHIPIETGMHRMGIQIGETDDPGEWTYRAERELEFRPGYRHAVTFNKAEGFKWH